MHFYRLKDLSSLCVTQLHYLHTWGSLPAALGANHHHQRASKTTSLPEPQAPANAPCRNHRERPIQSLAPPTVGHAWRDMDTLCQVPHCPPFLEGAHSQGQYPAEAPLWLQGHCAMGGAGQQYTALVQDFKGFEVRGTTHAASHRHRA